MDYTIYFAALITVLIAGIVVMFLRGASSKTVLPAIITAFVAIALVAVVVPMTTEGENIPDVIQYDDYYDGREISSASGSLEIWTDGNGVNWLHAKDTGPGEYVKKGVTHAITVDKAPLHVVLSLGQSNGAYRLATADPGTADPVAPFGSCYYFGDSQRPTNYGRYMEDGVYGMHSMTTKYGTAKIGDFDEPFAAELYKLSGVKTYVINACVEGTSIASWVPGEYCYTYAQTILDKGLNAIDLDHYTPVSYVSLWNQGEGDRNAAVDTYKSELLSIFDNLKNGTFSTTEIDTMLIVKTRSIYTNSSIAQTELAAEVPGIYLATTLADTFTVSNGKMNADNVHYSQLGDNALGVAVATFYIEKVIE